MPRQCHTTRAMARARKRATTLPRHGTHATTRAKTRDVCHCPCQDTWRMPRPVLRRITRTTTRVKTRDTCHDHYHGASAQALTMVLWRVLWPPLPWCYNPCQDTWHVTRATIYATTPTKTPRHTSTTRVRTHAKSHTWHVSSPVRWCVPQPPTIVPCPEPRHVTHVPIRARPSVPGMPWPIPWWHDLC